MDLHADTRALFDLWLVQVLDVGVVLQELHGDRVIRVVLPEVNSKLVDVSKREVREALHRVGIRLLLGILLVQDYLRAKLSLLTLILPSTWSTQILHHSLVVDKLI